MVNKLLIDKVKEILFMMPIDLLYFFYFIVYMFIKVKFGV